MANPETGLIDWALANASGLGLEATRLDWIDEILPGWVNFKVCLTSVGDFVAVGTGVGESEEIAFAKALSEAIERAAMFAGPFKNSNGFAAHTSEEKAFENAKRELLERDAFFCHFLTRTPFEKLSITASLNEFDSPLLISALHSFERYAVQFNFGQMRVESGVHGVVVAARGTGCERPFGLHVSLAVEESLSGAVKKAITAVLMNVYHGIHGEAFSAISSQELASLAKVTVSDQLRFAASPDQGNMLEGLWPVEHLEHAVTTDARNVEVERVELPEMLKGAPIIVARATSPNVQNLYFGTPQLNDLNFERLSEFAGRLINRHDLGSGLHPFA